MAIDPISVATQGYIIQNATKELFGITLGTLGYIKPAENPLVNIRKRLGGGKGGVAIGFKKTMPPQEREMSFDIITKAAFTKANDKTISQKLQTKKYKNQHKPIKVEVQRLVHKNKDIDLTLYEVSAVTTKPRVSIGKVKLLPFRTLVSSSVKHINKKKQ